MEGKLLQFTFPFIFKCLYHICRNLSRKWIHTVSNIYLTRKASNRSSESFRWTKKVSRCCRRIHHARVTIDGEGLQIAIEQWGFLTSLITCILGDILFKVNAVDPWHSDMLLSVLKRNCQLPVLRLGSV